MEWFEERLETDEGRAVRIGVTAKLACVRSPYQTIEVFDTASFGRMLVHDGVIMATERDEAHYHEMIVHVPLAVHPAPRRVLVIGGGDGGTVREVCRHAGVEEIDLCEIDEQVVSVCREYLPGLTGGFADPRVALHFADGAKWVAEHPGHYDVILVDSSDPIGPAEVLFRREFFASLHGALREDGIAVTQSESFHYHARIIGQIARFGREIFPVYRYYYTLIPTYPSGVIGFSFLSKRFDPLRDGDPGRLPFLADLKYYTPALHRAAFVLPAFTRAFLPD